MTQSHLQHDQLYRFIFDNHDVRGEFVTLNATYQAMLKNHDYPPAVQHLLGEMLVASSLLTATLKFEGKITLQLQGDGPLSLMVINGDNHQHFRGIARIREAIKPDATLKEMLGQSLLIITIMPKNGERFQGIIALEKETLSGCIEDYFLQSEQLPTRIFTFVSTQPNTIASGLLLQVLPNEKETKNSLEHLALLAETLTQEECNKLAIKDILFRLYHQETLRLFEPQDVMFYCDCSRERTLNSLLLISPEEINELLEQDSKIEMHCDYCGNHYIFDRIDIDEMQINHNKKTPSLH